jgi:hypothetical protein
MDGSPGSREQPTKFELIINLKMAKALTSARGHPCACPVACQKCGDRPELLEIRGRAALFINPAHGKFATKTV